MLRVVAKGGSSDAPCSNYRSILSSCSYYIRDFDYRGILFDNGDVQWREGQISPLLVICHISYVPSKCHNKALQNGYWHPWMASRSEKVREKLHCILNQHTRDCSKTQCEREKQLNFDQRLKIWNCARTGAGSCPEREAWSWRPLSSSGEQRQEYLRIFYTFWGYLKISLTHTIWRYLRIIIFTWRWEAKISQGEITAYLDWETTGWTGRKCNQRQARTSLGTRLRAGGGGRQAAGAGGDGQQGRRAVAAAHQAALAKGETWGRSRRAY